MIKLINKITGQKAFMIVEMIVAVALITFSIIGPLSAAKSSLVAAADIRNHVESVYLADEAVEYIRMVRDNNIFEGRGWLDSLGDCFLASGCGISVTENNVSKCLSGTGDCELKFNQSTGLFTYRNGSGWLPTGIKRKVRLTETAADREAEIVVTIERRRLDYPTRTYTMRAILMNWKQQITP
ncbi:MAG: hypothetical protein HYV68_00365 [Candidatus Taylorbacteria bacterium]|nr:hypothetical protein [Candidatus Taylorbacteria bacterium]